ncbi:MAG: VPLPA-CTERM sorting domain-containing protein [Pseudomonadota bacterium]|nr:hypothetical protein [Pseudomonadales bacterium]MDY6919697.1 VPLPA-CTERM sorting domain-containing protein [Pseudomonadota bacterium]
MFKKIAVATLLTGVAGIANAASLNYGWEDGVGTVLGSFNDDGMQYSNTDALAYSGNRALLIEDLSDQNTGTPQGYVAWVTGLADGDTVTAGFWAYDVSAGAAPSARIWGHYTTDDTDIESYAGSAGGNSTFSDGSGWSYLEYTWTFDSNGGERDGLVVESRFYDGGDAPTGAILIDDLSVTSSAGMITSPVPLPAAAWLFITGLAGVFGVRLRQRA